MAASSAQAKPAGEVLGGTPTEPLFNTTGYEVAPKWLRLEWCRTRAQQMELGLWTPAEGMDDTIEEIEIQTVDDLATSKSFTPAQKARLLARYSETLVCSMSPKVPFMFRIVNGRPVACLRATSLSFLLTGWLKHHHAVYTYLEGLSFSAL